MGCNVKIMNSYAFEKKNVPQTGPLSIAGGGRNAYRHTHTSTHTCTHTQTHRHRQRHTDTHRHTNKHTHTLTLSKKKKNSLLGPQNRILMHQPTVVQWLYLLENNANHNFNY